MSEAKKDLEGNTAALVAWQVPWPAHRDNDLDAVLARLARHNDELLSGSSARRSLSGWEQELLRNTRRLYH